MVIRLQEFTERGAAELESYRKIVDAAVNDVTAKAYALAGADMTRANAADCEVARCEVALLARIRVLVWGFV